MELLILNFNPFRFISLLVPCILCRNAVLEFSSKNFFIVGQMGKATAATGLTLGRDVE